MVEGKSDSQTVQDYLDVDVCSYHFQQSLVDVWSRQDDRKRQETIQRLLVHDQSFYLESFLCRCEQSRCLEQLEQVENVRLGNLDDVVATGADRYRVFDTFVLKRLRQIRQRVVFQRDD